MIKKLGSKTAAILTATSLVLAAGCGKQEEEEKTAEEEEEERKAQVLANGNSQNTQQYSAVPQVGTINLANLGDSGGAALQDDGENKCDDGPDLGLFGLALGGACHTAGFAAEIMLGSEDGDHNGDGTLDCSDFTEGKDNGILLGLMCGDIFQRFDGVESFAFDDADKGETFGLSFADFDADDDVEAAGNWTKGNAASYPANIRIWIGDEGFENMHGAFGANLSSLNSGEVQVDFKDDSKNERFRVSSKFANNLETKSGCAETPNADNCVYQEVKIFNPGDESAHGAPNGMHLRIMTDDKSNPTFYLIEGRYTYEAAKAAGFADFGLGNTREIYFKTIQDKGQIWGSFEFRDENGDYVELAADPFNIIETIRNGVCKDTDDGEDATCTDVDPDEFSTVWVGRDAMDDMSETPVTIDFTTGLPEKSELCLEELESCIDLSDK